MSSPLFSIGEEVIAVLENSPEKNGEYIVEDIKFYETAQGTNNKVFKNTYGYRLVGFTPSKDADGYVLECALRKKHKPSEFDSFESLMDNLNLIGCAG